MGDVPAEESYRKPVLFMSDLRVSPAKAAELKSKLEQIMDSLKDESGDDPDRVPVTSSSSVTFRLIRSLDNRT